MPTAEASGVAARAAGLGRTAAISGAITRLTA